MSLKDIPAFPSHGSMGEVTHEGMSLRDYFAAKALAGAIAKDGCTHILMTRQYKDCWRLADLMLKAREKRE